MKQENTMTRTAIMEKLTTMGVPFKKKDSLQALKDTLENALNERHYEKYGRPTENAMEQEAQKLMENLVNALTTKKEKENTMNTENTTPAIVDAVNTEDTKENTTMNQNTEKRNQKEAEKKAKAEKRAAEKAKKEAEKKAEQERKAQAKADLKALNDAIIDAVHTLADANGLTVMEMPKKNAIIVRMGNHRVFEIYNRHGHRELFLRDDVARTGWWNEILGSLFATVTFNYDGTYRMKHWYNMDGQTLLNVLAQM